MHTISHMIWNFGIDKTIREVNNKEQAQEFIDSHKELSPDQVYRMLQRVRTYFQTPHNGQPLTIFQSNTLMEYQARVRKLIY